jgi:hypothetical protein
MAAQCPKIAIAPITTTAKPIAHAGDSSTLSRSSAGFMLSVRINRRRLRPMGAGGGDPNHPGSGVMLCYLRFPGPILQRGAGTCRDPTYCPCTPQKYSELSAGSAESVRSRA